MVCTETQTQSAQQQQKSQRTSCNKHLKWNCFEVCFGLYV